MASAVIVISEKCPYCIEVVNFIREHPVLIPMVKTHNINREGVPEGITRVPILITSDNKRHMGIEVLRWLETMIPTNFEGNWCSSCAVANFDEPFDEIGDSFPIDAYGISLAPQMTNELKQKIDRSVNDAYADIKKNTRPNK
jgi:hypothetical protein